MRRIDAALSCPSFLFFLAACLLLGQSSVAAGGEPPSTDLPSNPFRISTHAPDGTLVDEFIATLDDMHIDQVKLGPDGNIWLTRADNSHSSGVPNPNDMVAVFTPAGVEINTIAGGGMRHPLSVGWDSVGNIYVNAEDNFFATDVYKYDAGGAFLTAFHTQGWSLIDEYNDIVTTDDDRLFVTSWHGTGNDDQMTEFDTAGATINTFSPTGPSYFHEDVALSPATTLWVRTRRNGPGDDLVREFRTDGSQIDYFSTTNAVPNSNMRGLEVDAGGSIYVLNSSDHTLYELDDDGNVLDQTLLQGLTNWITDFTFGPGGQILVANQSPTSASIRAGAPPAGGLQLVAAPNPFDSRVELRFTTPVRGTAELAVYDVTGRLVRRLATRGVNGVVAWDGRDTAGRGVADGVYFVRLVNDTEERTVTVRRLR